MQSAPGPEATPVPIPRGASMRQERGAMLRSQGVAPPENLTGIEVGDVRARRPGQARIVRLLQ